MWKKSLNCCVDVDAQEEERRKKAEALKRELEENERKSVTMHPKINKKSKQLVQSKDVCSFLSYFTPCCDAGPLGWVVLFLSLGDLSWRSHVDPSWGWGWGIRRIASFPWRTDS